MQDDQTKTACEVHDNIAGYRQGGLSVNYSGAPRPWWRVNLYGYVYLREYTGNYYGRDYRQREGSFSFNISNQLTLGHKWSAEVAGWHNGPALSTVFSRSRALGSVNAAISKTLLNYTLVLKLAVNDILGTQRYHAANRFGNFDTDVTSTWDARRAIFSVAYSFGAKVDLMQRKSGADGRRM